MIYDHVKKGGSLEYNRNVCHWVHESSGPPQQQWNGDHILKLIFSHCLGYFGMQTFHSLYQIRKYYDSFTTLSLTQNPLFMPW